MASENEPAKLLLPYLQRADELQKHEPLVAYYCRLYAMERGLKIPQGERTKTTNALLISLMNQLEKDKKSLKLGPDDHLHVEGFALNVFAKADKQDRAGRADLNTAKTFYAASIFFEILNQFGEVQPDLEQKQKYAVWKAADIRKALKEGRKPVPGPPGGDEDLTPSSRSNSEYDVEPTRNDFSMNPEHTRIDPAARTVQDSDLSPKPHDHDKFQRMTSASSYPSDVQHSPSSSISPPPHYSTEEYPSDNFNVPPQTPSDLHPHSSNVPPSSRYPSRDHTSDNFHQPPPTHGQEHSVYQQSYHQPPYQQEPHHQAPHYPSQDVPSFSYPNFQSYPSFTESSLPTAPTHYPSFYQSSDASYANSMPPNTAPHPSTAQYDTNGRNGSVSEASPPTTQKYEYDSTYQPPPEKIAEAHKAARFAVGALAFDDVFVAVDYLKKSLELLTNPSAGE